MFVLTERMSPGASEKYEPEIDLLVYVMYQVNWPFFCCYII